MTANLIAKGLGRSLYRLRRFPGWLPDYLFVLAHAHAHDASSVLRPMAASVRDPFSLTDDHPRDMNKE